LNSNHKATKLHKADSGKGPASCPFVSLWLCGDACHEPES
jgi:hypothetical protein